MVVLPCAQFRAATRCKCTPVDRVFRVQKFELAIRQLKNRRFVINDGFGRDLYQNESPVDVRSFAKQCSLDDRRLVVLRPDFRTYRFHALVAQLGFHAHTGAPSHGKNSADAARDDSRHDDPTPRPSARLRLPGYEILRAARWPRLPVAHGSRKPGRTDYCQRRAHAAFAYLWVRSGVPESLSLVHESDEH
jgi:hypothetical protein